MESIDYKNMAICELYMAQEFQTYPPRICYGIGSRNSDKVVINFSGLEQRKFYEVIPKETACKSYDKLNIGVTAIFSTGENNDEQHHVQVNS